MTSALGPKRLLLVGCLLTAGTRSREDGRKLCPGTLETSSWGPWPIVFAAIMTVLVASARVHAETLDLAARTSVVSGARAHVRMHLDQVIRESLPDTLFGFNINVVHFQRTLWDASSRRVKPSVIDHMRAFPGAIYRYPGGLIGNQFNWQWSVGDDATRRAMRLVKWREPLVAAFGLSEYLDFVRRVGGRDWYVLNLVGWDKERMFHELPMADVIKQNEALARYMKTGAKGVGVPRYYQLGNELDRASYQWPHEKYVSRSRQVIDAVSAIDPSAKFVAFLRDFDWRYRGVAKNRGRSKAADLAHDVLTGLPEVEDVSLLLYYDGLPDAKRHVYLGTRLKQTLAAIEMMKSIRADRPIRIWFTEHAANWHRYGPQKRGNWRQTSSLAGAISSADFLIAMAQVPEVQGAVWHAFNGGPWFLLDAETNIDAPEPRPVYWGFRVLRQMTLPKVVATRTTSPNASNYRGGYDVRAAGFRDVRGGKLGLWVINRNAEPYRLALEAQSRQQTRFTLKHYFITGQGVFDDASETPTVVELEPEAQPVRWERGSAISVTIPAHSVSTLVFTPNPDQ